MAQRVMLKRAEKAKQLFDELGKDCAFDDFYERFRNYFQRTGKVSKKNITKRSRRQKKERGILCLIQPSM